MKKNNTIYFIITGIYSVLIMTLINKWSPCDDSLLVETTKNRELWGISSGGGRFCPLNGIDYYILDWIVGEITGNNLYLIYIISGVTFFISAFILKNILPEKVELFVILLLFATMISPAVASIFFRVFFSERYILLFMLWIIYLFIKGKKSIWNGFLIILFGNIIIYSKEPGILAMISFGLGIILKNFLNKEIQNKKWHYTIGISLIASGFSAVALWVIYILPNTFHRYGENNIPIVFNFLKSIVEWTIADPLLFLLFIPMCLQRYFVIFKKKQTMDSWDVVALMGLGYMVTLFLTRMAYQIHYMTPVYGVAISYITHNVYKKQQKNFVRYKIILSICILVMINSVPAGINYISFQRYNNKNFTAIIATIDSLITHRDSGRVNFHVLGGQDWGNNTFATGLLSFIQGKGHTSQEFDFLSYEGCSLPRDPGYTVQFSFIDTRKISVPKKGDYILITPYCREELRKPSFPVVLIKSWDAPKNIPNFDIKDGIRGILLALDKVQHTFCFSQYMRNKKTGIIRAQYFLYKVL